MHGCYYKLKKKAGSNTGAGFEKGMLFLFYFLKVNISNFSVIFL